jgi:hypothetical protein
VVNVFSRPADVVPAPVVVPTIKQEPNHPDYSQFLIDNIK